MLDRHNRSVDLFKSTVVPEREDFPLKICKAGSWRGFNGLGLGFLVDWRWKDIQGHLGT